MQTVSYYMKGQPLQYKSFETLAEARAFMQALNENTDCESYQLER